MAYKRIELVSEKSSYLGKCSKATGKWRYLVDKDFVIEVFSGFWEPATQNQKEALLLHELCHIISEENDEGEITWKIKKHDLEEFNFVVEKYKDWRPELSEFKKCLNGKEEKKD